jgi:hypothetical protein
MPGSEAVPIAWAAVIFRPTQQPVATARSMEVSTAHVRVPRAVAAPPAPGAAAAFAEQVPVAAAEGADERV